MQTDQTFFADALRKAFQNLPVEADWKPLAIRGGVYSPPVDIAVGPFGVVGKPEADYDGLVVVHYELLLRLHTSFARNVRSLDANDVVPDLASICALNRNARCFLAVETEASGSSKHIMGGAINAAALGRIGVSLGCSPAEFLTLLHMQRYFRFLGRNRFDMSNLLVVTKEQFADALEIELPTA